MNAVLLIDDEPEVLRSTGRALESGGFAVMTAAEGTEGLRLASRHRPDMVVLDLGLPDLPGEAVLAALLAEGSGRRVLVLSRAGEVRPVVRGLDAEAVDFLPKPFGVNELVARVRLRLSQPRGGGGREEQQLLCSHLRLDLRTRRLHTPSRSAELAQREFELVRYLMRRAGTVCSRAELLHDVWGFDVDPGSNVVDVTVARVRAKLHDVGITTVRNVGYTLDDDRTAPADGVPMQRRAGFGPPRRTR